MGLPWLSILGWMNGWMVGSIDQCLTNMISTIVLRCEFPGWRMAAAEVLLRLLQSGGPFGCSQVLRPEVWGLRASRGATKPGQIQSCCHNQMIGDNVPLLFHLGLRESCQVLKSFVSDSHFGAASGRCCRFTGSGSTWGASGTAACSVAPSTWATSRTAA